MPTISSTLAEFNDMLKRSRSAHTALSYAQGLAYFVQLLNKHGLDPQSSEIGLLDEEAALWLLEALKDFSPATEQLYLAAVKRFYQYLSARRLANINLPRLNEFILQQARRPGQRLPQFPREAIEKTLAEMQKDDFLPAQAGAERLRFLRDRAFLLTLADTGLRVHEACALRRGDMDWNEGRAIIIGKGDKQAVIRFSGRALTALREYLAARASLDGAAGKALSSLALFARHDKGAGQKIKALSSAGGRLIVAERVHQALADFPALLEQAENISPHSFRHYFVTTVLRASGNLKLAQELARHANIAVTQRYAHISDDELDQGYGEIFG